MAQQISLRYLEGDQVPQMRSDFVTGALYLEGAKTLTPESTALECKTLFFRGRALLFDKKYRDAANLLERAALDPAGAYSQMHWKLLTLNPRIMNRRSWGSMMRLIAPLTSYKPVLSRISMNAPFFQLPARDVADIAPVSRINGSPDFNTDNARLTADSALDASGL